MGGDCTRCSFAGCLYPKNHFFHLKNCETYMLALLSDFREFNNLHKLYDLKNSSPEHDIYETHMVVLLGPVFKRSPAGFLLC